MGIAGIAVYFTKASCWISLFLYGFLLAVFPMVQSLTVKKVILSKTPKLLRSQVAGRGHQRIGGLGRVCDRMFKPPWHREESLGALVGPVSSGYRNMGGLIPRQVEERT